MEGSGSTRLSAVHRAADRVEQLIENGQIVVAVTLATLLALLQIPPVEEVATKLGLENSTRLRTAVGVILLAAIMLELRQLRRTSTPTIAGGRHYQDPKAMYNDLMAKAAEIVDPDHQQMDVLGLTLFSAWPELEFFLERPEVRNWRIRLATLSSSAAPTDLCIPEGWPKESETTVRQVLEFRDGQGADHRHEIEVYEYQSLPAVHGFRLGNGDVFISTLLWKSDGRLGKHRFPYDYYPAHDVSPVAAAARALFKNWFDHALASAEETAAANK